MCRKKFILGRVDNLWGEIRRKRVNPAAIARMLGSKDRFPVYAVIRGKSKNAHIRKALAQPLGRKPKGIWPDYVPERGSNPQ